MSAIQSRSIALPSGSVRYLVTGSGPALVYLHPMGGLRWTRVLERLAATHTVYAPTLPGFDGTPLHAGVASGAALGGLTAAFIEAVVGPRADVYGHSFGGWVAMWLAAEHPARIDHLVLEAPGGLRPAEAPPPPADPAAFQRALWLRPENHLADLREPGADAGNPAMRTHYALPASIDEALAPKLGTIAHQTLLLGGTADIITPSASQRYIKSRLPNCYLIYVYDAAHGIAGDQPDRTGRVVESFLTRSEAFLVNWGTSRLQDRG